MIQDAFRAASNYIEALRLISELRLWKYVLLPGLLSIILASLILGGVYVFSDNIAGWLMDLLPWSLGDTVDSVASIITGLVLGVFGLLILKYIVLILVGPFMSPLSERIESHLTGMDVGVSAFDMKANFRLMVRGIRLSLRNIIREIFFVIPLVLLGLIPGVGIFTSVLIFLTQAFFAGFGNMDFTLERYYNVRESVRFTKNNKGIAIGNGSVFLFLFMIPVIGFFLAPALATVAATISCIDRLEPATAKRFVSMEL